MLKQAFNAIGAAFGFVVLTATTPVFANDSASALTTQGIELRAVEGIELRKEKSKAGHPLTVFERLSDLTLQSDLSSTRFDG